MAIVLAMLLAAFAATVAASLLWEQARWVSEQEHRADQVQAQALAMAGVNWARQILYEDRRTGGAIDHLGEPWAFRLPATPMEHGSITGSIDDVQGRLNIDALRRPEATDARARFVGTALRRLFAQSGLPVAVLDAIGDWIDTDSDVRGPGGAEDPFYLALPVPTLAANAPVQRLTEILAVRGADAAQLERVRGFIDAIDADTTLNVNTASAEVLSAAVPGLDRDQAAALVRQRGVTPFGNIDDFRARLPSSAGVTDASLLSVASDYFSVTVEARQGDSTARARALLHRPATGWPDVVWQTVE
jgi:general secretion pathway protein K